MWVHIYKILRVRKDFLIGHHGKKPLEMKNSGWGKGEALNNSIKEKDKRPWPSSSVG